MKSGFSEDGRSYIANKGGHSVRYPAQWYGGKSKKKGEKNSDQLGELIRRIVAEELRKLT